MQVAINPNSGIETEEQREFIEQITKECTPMRLTDYMVDHPCKVLLGSYACLLLFAILTGILGYMMPQLEGSRGREFLIWKDPLQVDADKLSLATEYITDTKGEAVVDLQVESTNFIFLLYSNTGDKEFGLLNKDILTKIKSLETTLQDDEEYKKFCLAKKPLQPDDPPQCKSDAVYSSLNTILDVWEYNPVMGMELPVRQIDPAIATQ